MTATNGPINPKWVQKPRRVPRAPNANTMERPIPGPAAEPRRGEADAAPAAAVAVVVAGWSRTKITHTTAATAASNPLPTNTGSQPNTSRAVPRGIVATSCPSAPAVAVSSASIA